MIHTGRVVDGSVHTPRGSLPAGLPGWRRAPCLGCGGKVVQARDGWVTIGGTRTGSYLLLWGAEPLRSYATDSHSLPDEQLFVLGVAHQGCIDKARARLETCSVALLDDLPILHLEFGADALLPPYTLHIPSEPSACAFCDSNGSLTREHVWPDWYSREIQARGVTLTASSSVVKNRIEVTVPVCATCNNGWMSVLENDTKPLLLSMMNAPARNNPSICLSPADQTRLATWAVKTAYLIDAYQQPAVPRGFLHQLALKRVPNDWTVVWVGGYSADVAVRAEKWAMDFLASTGTPTVNSPNGFVVTFTLANVLFQVMGHFNGGTARMRDDRRQYGGALFRLWPAPAVSLSWPPAVGFSCTSWGDLVVSITDGRTAQGQEPGVGHTAGT